MYNDNYRYGTGLYAPAVHQINRRDGDFFSTYTPSIPMPIMRDPPTIPRVPLLDHDLYAPVSYGYGRSLLKPRPVVQREHRIPSRYYPSYYGMEF